MKKLILFFAIAMLAVGCSEKVEPLKSFVELVSDSPSITGKKDYLSSPMVTAGDRVYMVGHQDGSFPELGWHIKGEMGGIWDHPIKLMDGFDILLSNNKDSLLLDKAESFTNYPFANKHTYRWESKGLEIERWQFVPDGKEGILVQLAIKNTGSSQNINIEFTGHSDLRPTWLGEQTQMIDGTDQGVYQKKLSTWVVKDSLNPWFTVFGSTQKAKEHSQKESDYNGNGISNTLEYELNLSANQTGIINFTIAGSYVSEEEAIATFQSITNDYEADISAKKVRYAALAQKSKLTVPDKNIEEAFEWIKYNSDWLVRTVPEIGTGIGAGIPDYPWWFGVDSEYALQGYMAVGQKETVYSTIKLLDSVSEAVNGNGRIIHEMSTNGAVFNKGNVNETAQFASLIWKVYQWNGDKDFLEKYFPTIEKGFNWLIKPHHDRQNLFPTGYGMMEIHGMNTKMIDVASYTQKAFADASKIANELGKSGLSLGYAEIAKQLKREINEQFWNEEAGSYGDFIGRKDQALQLIEDAIVRADTLNKPWAVAELKTTKEAIENNSITTPRPYVVHHNWVVNTPMEVGIAPPYKALKALNTAEKFVNPFGVFVTGIDRDESAGLDDGSFKGSKIFSYTGAVMTLPTGVQIVAENNYGRTDKALNYMKRMTRSFSYALPGSMYEVSPDYGMMTQAWNIYGYAIPIVEQFFGIEPDAANFKVVITPQMPLEWNNASLENVEIGNNQISIYYGRKNGETIIRVTQTQPNWELEINLPREPLSDFEVTKGSSEDSISEDYFVFSTKDKEVEITLQDGES